MDPKQIAIMVAKLLIALAPKVYDLVERGFAGDDITAEQLWSSIPHEERSAAAAEMMEANRRRLGLPV